MGIYDTLGLRPVINARSRVTVLGGSLLPEPVVRAMAEAARAYVDIFELQRRAGRRVAELTGNEAAYVCNGATAGLFISTLACMTGTDAKAVARLPRLDGLKTEVIIHRTQRVPMDLAIELTGARLVEIGNSIHTPPVELEAAITDATAAVFYMAGEEFARGAIPLRETIEIAHARGVPVVVDAAAQLPPPRNLWRFTREMGADLAVFSGGKDLSGPQSSGIIFGRPELIEACFLNGPPHTRLARPMKIGKEEIAGVTAAVEWYLGLDHAAREARCGRAMRMWEEGVNEFPGCRMSAVPPFEKGEPPLWVRLEVDPEAAGITAAELHRRLLEGDPAVAVGLNEGRSEVELTPYTIEPGEDEIILLRLTEILRAAAKAG